MLKPILSVTKLRKMFGGLTAVDDVTFEVDERAIVSVIGPNGAGKTTFFNVITGIYRPDAGTIEFCGRDLVGRRPDQIAAFGMARTFQNIRLFNAMTVLENVLVSQHARIATTFVGALLRTKSFQQEEDRAIKRGYDLLDCVGLARKADSIAGNLSYGEQRRLEVARALATRPALVLLDEPSAGMNPQETREIRDLILRMRDDFGVSVVLIEHDMPLVMSVSDRVTVLDYGRKIAEGLSSEVRTDPRVVEAYLGRGVAARIAGADDTSIRMPA